MKEVVGSRGVGINCGGRGVGRDEIWELFLDFCNSFFLEWDRKVESVLVIVMMF